jgi:hypothetical protein
MLVLHGSPKFVPVLSLSAPRAVAVAVEQLLPRVRPVPLQLAHHLHPVAVVLVLPRGPQVSLIPLVPVYPTSMLSFSSMIWTHLIMDVDSGSLWTANQWNDDEVPGGACKS